MTDQHHDVLVVGSGPAGSVAALVLARAGARVALVDKAAFPREKACGDLVGPRGVQVLTDLDLEVSDAMRVSDMIVVGPTGNRVRLPAKAGRTYPGHGIVASRSTFDAMLRNAAIDAGAHFYEGRADEALGEPDRLTGFALSSRTRVRADVVIGADGATSRVAAAAGLVDDRRVLWGFAVRTHLDQDLVLPHIMLWTPTPGEGFPGYGWAFPAGPGRVNIGLGIGVLTDRAAARRVVHDLDAFLEHTTHIGVLDRRPTKRATERPLGAWLKMGLVGTTPACGGVLLVGDAAGLVNPLQGEGIAQAMDSGRAAAEAILAGVDGAAARYRAHLASVYAPYLSTSASLHRAMLPRPKLVANLTRGLTAPGVGRAIAGGWSITWNDLLDGATPSAATTIAATAAGLGRAVTAYSGDRRWIRRQTGRGRNASARALATLGFSRVDAHATQ